MFSGCVAVHAQMAERVMSCYNARARPAGPVFLRFMVACIGPLTTINCEPGQAWKGAAAAVDLGVGVWLVRVASIIIDRY